MNIWQWTRDYARAAYENNDEERLRLARFHYTALAPMRTAPDEALSHIELAIALARQLNEPWWILFYEHWKLQTLIFFKRDFAQALPLAVRCAVEVRKPIYAQFPQRVCLHEDLINAYVGTDAKGYFPAIQGALDYMNEEIAPGSECRHCHRSLLCEFAIKRADWDASLDCGLDALAFAQAAHHAHHTAGIYPLLCQIAWARDDWDNLLAWARDGEEAIAKMGRDHDLELAQVQLWQALALNNQGEAAKAASLFRAALQRARRVSSTPESAFYRAACAYHEARGDLESALRVLDEERETLVGKGRHDALCHCLLKICALRGEMALPWQEARQELETVARNLIEPAPILDELQELARRYPSS